MREGGVGLFVLDVFAVRPPPHGFGWIFTTTTLN